MQHIQRRKGQSKDHPPSNALIASGQSAIEVRCSSKKYLGLECDIVSFTGSFTTSTSYGSCQLRMCLSTITTVSFHTTMSMHSISLQVGQYGGLMEEVETLKRDKNVLMMELVHLRQKQSVGLLLLATA